MTLPGTDLTLLFPHPAWLWPLPLVLLIPLLRRWRPAWFPPPAETGAETRELARHPLAELLAKTAGQRNERPFGVWLTPLIAACLLLSLSEPILRGQRLPDPPPERDIVFIVDTSVAMILRDYLLEGRRVDRMSLLKEMLDRMAQRLAGDRIGIIVYGDHAHTLAPLTRDQALTRAMLKRIEATLAGRFAATGEAIALAVRQARSANNGGQPRHRILVLLTAASGATGAIDERAAAQLAAENGMPLYAIAIGAASHAADEPRKGGLLYEPADLKRLESLAAITGAQAFRAGDGKTLQHVLQEIDQREAERREQPARYVNHPLYQWPLLAALLLMLLKPVIPELWSRRHA